MNHTPVILGPTASGKTAVSIELAHLLDAEIISADSRLVYTGLDIGTAKPTMSERAGIPHHLIDIVHPSVNFTVADYQRRGFETLGKIREKRNAIIAGGTGLYIRALVDNPSFQDTPPDEEIRRQIHNEIDEKGSEALYEELRRFDPEAALKINPGNIPRLVRAIEVIRLTGRKFSDRIRADRETSTTENPVRFALFGLLMDRDLLYEIINRRVDGMVRKGWVGEVVSLLDSGLSGEEKPMKSLGYRDIVDHVRGRISLDEAVERIKRDTRRFAKRQITWFKHMDGIEWIEIDKSSDPRKVAEPILFKIKTENNTEKNG